jgi:hypothetical protein
MMRTTKEWLVPRRDLVADMSLLFEQGRIAFAHNIQFREAIMAQLNGFRNANPANKKPRFEAESEDLHDDFVVDIAMAAWWVHHFESEVPEGEFIPKSESNQDWDPLSAFSITEENDDEYQRTSSMVGR